MMMLNRDRDRERGLPLSFFVGSSKKKSTHRNGANSNVLLSLVWFRAFPSPSLTRLLKAVILDFFFRMPPHLSTLILFNISSGL